MTQAVRSPRNRYFPGAAIWTLAQDAYLGGESAASIARRLNLTVNAIRKRAARKGWTRTQHAEALRRAEHPNQTLRVLLARIGQMAHAGRAETARLERHYAAKAEALATALLSERGYDLADNWALSALHWRARNLGSAQAEADYQRGLDGGWAARYWDREGRLRDEWG